jgi:hypothetical protein
MAQTQKPAPKPGQKQACKYHESGGNICMNIYPCEFKGPDLQCLSHGEAPKKSAGPAAAARPAAKPAPAKVAPPSRPVAPAKAASRPAAPKAASAPGKVEPRGTMPECAAGSEGFYYKGICLGGEHDSCPFQTSLRFPVKPTSPYLENKKFAKCMKYGIERCPKGDMSLYHPQKHICLATGKAPCKHQVAALMIPLEDSREYAYCDRYEQD